MRLVLVLVHRHKNVGKRREDRILLPGYFTLVKALLTDKGFKAE